MTDTITGTTLAKASYSTGQLAELCSTTVRTVQYYDQKGLLSPAARTPGDRRLYTDTDAQRLKQILLLKGLGVPLAQIRESLAGDQTTELVEQLLLAQDARLAQQMAEQAEARLTIHYLLRQLHENGELPTTTQADVERIMNADKQLKRARWGMAAMIALFLGATAAHSWALEHEGFAWTGLDAASQQNVFGMIASGLTAIFALGILWYYRKKVAFECPHCHTVFRGGFAQIFFAPHTPTTRRLRCPHCQQKSWCVEVGATRLDEDRS